MTSIPAFPETPAARRTGEYVRAHVTESVANHCFRTYLFAMLLAEHEGIRPGAEFDPELLFLACVMHDLGTSLEAPGGQRFELDGADMAAELLTGQGFGAQEVDLVWEAIARSPGVRRRPWVSIHAGGGSQRTSADIDVSGRTETETETTAADRTSPLGRRALTELLVADGMRLRRACASGAPG